MISSPWRTTFGPWRVHPLLACPPEHGADARKKQSLGERLGDVVVGAHAKPKRLVDLVVLAGEENHRQGGGGAYLLKKLHAVHARHLDVEHREFGLAAVPGREARSRRRGSSRPRIPPPRARVKPRSVYSGRHRQVQCVLMPCLCHPFRFVYARPVPRLSAGRRP